jgi:hypothetical protein
VNARAGVYTVCRPPMQTGWWLVKGEWRPGRPDAIVAEFKAEEDALYVAELVNSDAHKQARSRKTVQPPVGPTARQMALGLGGWRWEDAE